jgi:RNase P protein component
MSIDELLKRFEDACIEQYDTYVTDDTKKRNENFWILVAIKEELKARGPDARRALLRLLSHDNPQVRLQAAKFVYPVARDEAKRCLQEIAAANLPDQSLSAGMALYRLEEVPDCLDH